MLTVRQRTATLAIVLVLGSMSGTLAQGTAADPHHPETPGTAETAPPAVPGEAVEPGQYAQPGPSGMMPSGMMSQRMMGGMMQPGMMDAMGMQRMHGHMMKIMFAIADENGDGGLSFEEISAIQKRIFDAVDADQSGTVTPEEMQSFMME